MKRKTFLFIVIVLLLLINTKILNQQNIENLNNGNDNMKLIFVGDCMFGRNNNQFTMNPFQNVEALFKEASHIFLNLETTISPQPLDNSYQVDKVFNYQSNGQHLLSLKKITKKPIFTAIVNNHTLDYDLKGFENTKKFLKENNFHYTVKQSVEKNKIVFMNATDHCGCYDEDYWAEHMIMIDYDNLEPIYQKVRNHRDKFIVFSIHWGPNWVDGEMPDHIKNFGRGLIDNGVNVVFGHSSHHIVQNPVEEYNNGIIIYGLGDFINDYSVKQKYKSDEALIAIVTKQGKKLMVDTRKVKREFVTDGGSIPRIV